MLQTRLERLVEQGVLERRLYQERPPRYEYRLTEKGLDLWPIVVALMQWGDRSRRPPAGPPVVLEHRGCGGAVDEHRLCESCGKRAAVRDVRALRRARARRPSTRCARASASRPDSPARLAGEPRDELGAFARHARAGHDQVEAGRSAARAARRRRASRRRAS